MAQKWLAITHCLICQISALLSTGVFNGNIVGTSHDDVIMSEVGSVYIAGGDGNDRIGFISPFKGITDETSVLIGGAGADKFYLAVSEWMPPFEILDFNPAEGDQIELSPSYARYDDFLGFDVEAGVLNINFYDPFSFRSIDTSSGNQLQSIVIPSFSC